MPSERFKQNSTGGSAKPYPADPCSAICSRRPIYDKEGRATIRRARLPGAPARAMWPQKKLREQ
jgi:hypothetical protein